MRLLIVLAALLTSLMRPALASAQAYRVYGSEQFFTIDWAAGQSHGRLVISGYVFNHYGMGARQVRLLIESLDADQHVVDQTIGYVSGDLQAGSRLYFEVPLPRAAAAYRVNVLSWDWKTGHGA